MGVHVHGECSDAAGIRRFGNGHCKLSATQALECYRELVPDLTLPDEGAQLAQTIAALSAARTERLVFQLFDARKRYICSFERPGTRGAIRLQFRDLVERALANGAAGMLLIHNHPSGDPTPSAEDIAATRGLAALCLPLEVVVHDHLIVSRSALVSMRRAGLMDAQQTRISAARVAPEGPGPISIA